MLSATELAMRIARAMEQRGYVVDKGDREINIVYIEGMDLDGSANENRKNAFDDLRIVFTYKEGAPVIVGKWEATTQPGNRYTLNPINTKGGAIIELGQQRVWQTGLHRGQYEALIQTGGEVRVLRDKNKSFGRDAEDVVDVGWFGINQHHGGDAPRTDIGGHSAGCLVTPSVDDHEKFMLICKSDPRYKANNRFIFRTTVMPAAWILGGPKPERAPETHKTPTTELSILGVVLAGLGGAATFVAQHWWAFAVIGVCAVIAFAAYVSRKK